MFSYLFYTYKCNDYRWRECCITHFTKQTSYHALYNTGNIMPMLWDHRDHVRTLSTPMHFMYNTQSTASLECWWCPQVHGVLTAVSDYPRFVNTTSCNISTRKTEASKRIDWSNRHSSINFCNRKLAQLVRSDTSGRSCLLRAVPPYLPLSRTSVCASMQFVYQILAYTTATHRPVIASRCGRCRVRGLKLNEKWKFRGIFCSSFFINIIIFF